MVTGEWPGALYYPIVGGHEGAGIVEKVGPSVTRVKPGDHVLLTFMPACGKCRFCSMGQSFACYRGAGVILYRAPGDEDVRRALVVAAKTFFSIKMSVREPSLTNYNSTRSGERT